MHWPLIGIRFSHSNHAEILLFQRNWAEFMPESVFDTWFLGCFRFSIEWTEFMWFLMEHMIRCLNEGTDQKSKFKVKWSKISWNRFYSDCQVQLIQISYHHEFYRSDGAQLRQKITVLLSTSGRSMSMGLIKTFSWLQIKYLSSPAARGDYKKYQK